MGVGEWGENAAMHHPTSFTMHHTRIPTTDHSPPVPPSRPHLLL